MDYIINNLGGTLDSEANIPEKEELGKCQNRSSDATSTRVESYISDYFTTEDYLIDSLSLIGPTSTNIAVTPLMQFYGGGVYYEPEAEIVMGLNKLRVHDGWGEC